MTIRSEVPEVPEINLGFRPRSYFWPLDLETHLLTRVKGSERKAALERVIEAAASKTSQSSLLNRR